MLFLILFTTLARLTAYPVSTRFYRAFAPYFTPLTIYHGEVPIKEVIVLGTPDGGLQEINIESGDLEAEYMFSQRHSKQASFFLEIPFKNQFLTSDNAEIRLWNATKREPIFAVLLTDFVITFWCFDNFNKERILILTNSYEVKAFNIVSRTFSNIISQTFPISFSISSFLLYDANKLLVAQSDNRMRFFDIESSSYGDTFFEATGGTAAGHSKPVIRMLYVQAKNILISAGRDNTVIAWDFSKRAPLKQFTGFPSTVTSLLYVGGKEKVLVGTKSPASTTADAFVFQAIDLALLEIESKLKFPSTSLSGVTSLFYLPLKNRVLGHVGLTVGFFFYDISKKSLDRAFNSDANAVGLLALPSSSTLFAVYSKPFALKTFDIYRGTSAKEIPAGNLNTDIILTKMLYAQRRNSIVLAFSDQNIAIFKNGTFEKELEKSFSSFGNTAAASIAFDNPSGSLLILGADVIIAWDLDKGDSRSKSLPPDSNYKFLIVQDEVFVVNSQGNYFRLKISSFAEVQGSQGSIGRRVNALQYWSKYKRILFVGPFNTVEWISCDDYSQTGVVTTDPEMSFINNIEFLFGNEDLLLYNSNWIKVFDFSQNKEVFSLNLFLFGADGIQMFPNYHVIAKVVPNSGFLLMNIFCSEATHLFTCDKCSSSGQTAYPCQTCEKGKFLRNDLGVCENCNPVCSTCFDSNSSACLSCQKDYYWSRPAPSKTCVLSTDCQAKNYPDKITMACEGCHRSCANCTGPGPSECSSCEAPFFLDKSKGLCTESCPDNTYAENTPRECKPCMSGCKQCSKAENCISCLEASPYLFNGKCYLTCPSGTIAIASNNSCLGSPGTDKEDVDISLVSSMNNPTEAFIYFSSPIKLSPGDQRSFFDSVAVSVSGLEQKDFSYDWKFVNTQNIRLSLKYSKNLRKPELKIAISELNLLHLVDEELQSAVRFKRAEYKLSLLLPQYITDETSREAIESTEKINTFINSQIIIAGASIGTCSFFIKPISFIWSLVDAAQVMYMLLYIKINYPDNLLRFFNNFGSLNLELVPNIGRGKVEISSPNIDYTLFGVKVENQVAPDHFRKYGKSSNLLLNSASMCLVLLSFYMLYLLLKLLNKSNSSQSPKGKCSELIHKLLGAVEYDGLSRINQVVFNQVTLSICLQFHNIDFSAFFFNVSGFLASVLLSLYFLALFIILFRASNNFNLILDWNHPVSALFQDFNYEHFLQRAYFGLIFLKKLIVCCFLVLFHTQPDVCLLCLLLLQLFHLNITLYRPWFILPLNYLEVVCEALMTLVFLLVLVIFNIDSANREFPVITDEEYFSKTKIGWIVIGIFSSLLTFHLLAMLVGLYFSIRVKIIQYVAQIKGESSTKNILVFFFRLKEKRRNRQLSLSKSAEATVISFQNEAD